MNAIEVEDLTKNLVGGAPSPHDFQSELFEI